MSPGTVPLSLVTPLLHSVCPIHPSKLSVGVCISGKKRFSPLPLNKFGCAEMSIAERNQS